jgi:predicted PurR-regulated permease PerM
MDTRRQQVNDLIEPIAINDPAGSQPKYGDPAQARPASSDSAAVAEEMPLPHDWNTIFLGGLFFIACITVANIAQEVILPIVIAVVLKLLLQPLVRLLESGHIPKALGALIAVLLLLGLFAMLGAVLSGPVTQMVHDFPSIMTKARERFSAIQDLMAKAQPLMEKLGIQGENPMDLIHLDPGGMAGSVASGASGFASHMLETLLILFYMLVFGETFMRRLVEVLPRFGDKRQAVEISDAVERDISAYLLTITIINACVGILAGIAMWLFGVPGAVVWGVLAFCFNYVPIIGPITGIILFAIVGLATLGATWAALLPAATYLALHIAEGELITPMVLAKRFTLNPIGVMVSLVFWYWMWGVQGAILSVPLLAITKIISDRLRPLKALGHLLEG